MRQIFGIILVFGFLLIGKSVGQDIFGNDWLKDLFHNINHLNTNIQDNVQRIQQRVDHHLAQVDRMNADIAKRIVADPTGEHTLSVGNTGSTILINNAGGTDRRTVYSGQGPNGEAYFWDIEDRIGNGRVNRTERIYNPKTGLIDEYRYTRNLMDPNGKLEPLPAPSST